MIRRLSLVLLLLFVPLGTPAPPIQSGERDPYGMTFRFLGCSGDWVGHQRKPKITARVEDTRRVFHVEDPVECGLKVRKPGYTLALGQLSLSYETYADGKVAACYCAYHSEFSFQGLSTQQLNVEFSHD